ncbi:MAG: hypothetical protein JSV12_03500 [Candidatus Bathyarchaeota archaeon]|nr:MAG: hypothetical protein JSV12_03500 [Candidatus Bathyarchaeota archaeon]
MALLEVEPITDIVKLVLQSAYIKHTEAPVNLLLIAKPESAKTSAMSVFKIKGTYTTNNITQAVIVSEILPKIEREGLKHLIIPDLLNAIKKDYRTKEGFLQLMKTLIEEGITSLDTFHMRTHKVYDPPIKCGFITAITSESYLGSYNQDKQRLEGGLRRYWKNIGLLSRFIPFSYEYELSKIQRIFQFIQNEEHLKPTSKQTVKRKMVDVKGNPQLFQRLEILSVRVSQEVGGYGFRIQRSLQTLAKANAILNDRTEVAQQDIDKILELGNWMNKRFNPL